MRSRSLGKVRVDMTAGTVQPKPISIGTITAVLQQGEEEEHHHDHGHKAQHAAHALKQAAQDQTLDDGVHLPVRHKARDRVGQRIDAALQQILQEGADQGEGQEKDQAHDADKGGNGGKFAGENPVDPLAALMLRAFAGLGDALAAYALDIGVAHIRDGGAPIQTALVFHLQNDMVEQLHLVLVQLELLADVAVALHQLAGGEAQGKTLGSGVVLDQVAHRVQRAMHGAAVVVCAAVVLTHGPLLVFCHVDGVGDQLVDALVVRRGDRDHRDAQQVLHGVHVHAAAVAGHFVHHVQRDHHRDVHLQELHGQIEIALDVGGSLV